MAEVSCKSVPIESKRQLVEWLEIGCKPVSAFRIGTEHEKFPFYINTLKPVPYDGPNGISSLLKAMQEVSGWTPVREQDRLIGLSDPFGNAAISLEPGGQFELSGGLMSSIHETKQELDQHFSWCQSVAEPLGMGFLASGSSPLWRRDEVPLMPKGRYAIMARYMPEVGHLGLDMMRRTCTVQANLDFASEADMVTKLRVALSLQPIATALFANSPFLDGQPTGDLSCRSHIWQDTDDGRTGMLPFAFEEGMGFERYVDYALDVPMYFIRRQGRYVDVAGQSFREFISGRLKGYEGEQPLMCDWADHLTTIFPEVRLKRYLEMRGADCGPRPWLLALPAFWVGLLYDASNLDACWHMVKNWSREQRQRLRDDVPKLALKAHIAGRTVRDIAGDVLRLAREGLTRRACLNSMGQDETMYLEPLDTVVAHDRTQAEVQIEQYKGVWQHSVRPLFEINKI